MNRQDLQSYAMLTQMLNFGKQYVSLFSKKSAIAEILEALESGVNGMSENADEVLSAATALKAVATGKLEARQTLKAYLSRASQTGQALHNDKVPVSARKSDHALINVGRVFLADAASMKDELARHGLNFEEIQTSVQNLEQSLLKYTDAKAKRSAALQKWNAAHAEALDALRKLDVLVANTLSDDPGALALYTTARTIVRPGGGRKSKSDASGPSGAGAAPAAPAKAAATAA